MIRTRGLTVRYGGVTALRDVTLEVPRGVVAAITGPSGCGKSSLLAAWNRLLDMVPGASVQGTIEIGGQDVLASEVSVRELRTRVGMVFQVPNPFPVSIRRNVQLALREHGERRRARLDAVTERVLREVGLWEEVADRLEVPATALSGGQQQRLCIARALALEPEVLLMDEPCSALDPMATARIEELVASLRGRYTIVLVTHNLAQARRTADWVAVLWVRDGAGTLLEAGPAAELFGAPRDPRTEAYLQGLQG